MISSAGRRQKKKSRRRADTFSRAYSISAALIIRAAVSFYPSKFQRRPSTMHLSTYRHKSTFPQLSKKVYPLQRGISGIKMNNHII